MQILENLPLNALLAGQRGAVQALVGSPDEVRRLEELGLRVGTPLEMLRPGRTCIVRIAGNKLCIRGDELLRVMVGPPDPARKSA